VSIYFKLRLLALYGPDVLYLAEEGCQDPK